MSNIPNHVNMNNNTHVYIYQIMYEFKCDLEHKFYTNYNKLDRFHLNLFQNT